MLQIIRHICKDSNDNTKVALLFANQTESDILMRKELGETAENFPNKFKLWYTVDTAGDGKFKKLIYLKTDFFDRNIKKKFFPLYSRLELQYRIHQCRYDF